MSLATSSLRLVLGWATPTLSVHDHTASVLDHPEASSLPFMQPVLRFTDARTSHLATQSPHLSPTPSLSTLNLRLLINPAATSSSIPEALEPFTRNSKPMIAAVVGGVLALIILFFVTLYILRRRCRSGPPGTSTSVHFAHTT